jgi:uncharacterized protein YbjQ (UPF0145 family)
MARFDHRDILVELVELAGELMDDVKQQIVYHRASAYKNETAASVCRAIARLRLVAEMTGDESVIEAFADYAALCESPVASEVAGECSFSGRISHLMVALGSAMEDFGNRVSARDPSVQERLDLPSVVVRQRREIVAVCRAGSRQQMFFQAV